MGAGFSEGIKKENYLEFVLEESPVPGLSGPTASIHFPWPPASGQCPILVKLLPALHSPLDVFWWISLEPLNGRSLNSVTICHIWVKRKKKKEASLHGEKTEANAQTETKMRNPVAQTDSREGQRKCSPLAALIILAINTPCEHMVWSSQPNNSWLGHKYSLNSHKPRKDILFPIYRNMPKVTV